MRISGLDTAPRSLRELTRRNSAELWTRRLLWELVGASMARDLPTADERGVASHGAWAARLHPTDRRDLYRGLAVSSPRPRDPAALDQLPEDQRALHERAWHRVDITMCQTLLYEITEWDEGTGCTGPQGVWALGSAPGNRLVDLGSRFPIERVPADQRADFARGLGDAHGRMEGYALADCPLETHCQAWTEGFVEGAIEVFGVPPEDRGGTASQ